MDWSQSTGYTNYTPTGILILSYALTPAPSLSYFNVTALEGGRSVLLEWALEFDGGPKLEEFTIKVSLLAVSLLAVSLLAATSQ